MGPLIKRLSTALQSVMGCEKTYVVQFAEHPNHPHVHFHVIARDPDLAPEHRGPGIFQLMSANGAPPAGEERMNEIAREVLRSVNDA